MKEIYNFEIEKKVEKDEVFYKNTKDGTVEATRKIIDLIKTRIVFAKPSISMIEKAEFFYGQKYNEFISSGFFTKAMLNKKMGDIGGLSSKIVVESLEKMIVENLEASRTIQFYGASKDLSVEQQEKLEDAKVKFVETKNNVMQYEQNLNSQFSQTAETKAEQKLIEWLVFNLSYYEEEVDSKKQLFSIFNGDNFEEKRQVYLDLCEDIEDITDQSLLKIKYIFDKSFTTLVRVASIWYNKIAENPKDINEALVEMFESEEEDSEIKDVAEEATEESAEKVVEKKTQKAKSKKVVEFEG